MYPYERDTGEDAPSHYPFTCEDCSSQEIYYDDYLVEEYPIRCSRCNQFLTRWRTGKEWREKFWNMDIPKGERLRLVTFTRPNKIHPINFHWPLSIMDLVEEEMNLFKQTFLKLKRSVLFQRNYSGGCYVIEATAKVFFKLQRIDGRFISRPTHLSINSHCHVIASCKKYDWKAQDKWLRQYRMKVNTKNVYNLKGAIGYLTNYLIKGSDIQTRMRDTWGLLRKVKMESEINDSS